jgi:putative heme transporter
VVAGLVTVVVVRLIGRIDWAAVYDALRHLTWWQPFVLLAVVVVAVAILVAVLLVVRSDQLAIRVGSFSGRMARKVRPSVDPDAWVRACVDFRVQISARFRYGFVRSLLALCGMLAADLTVLVLSLRFVGVSSSQVPLLYAAIAYLFAHPFTLFPFSGLGIVDALVLAAVVEAGGLEVEAAAVAALVVWRAFTMAVPIVMGLGAVTAWRRGWLGDVPPEAETPVAG